MLSVSAQTEEKRSAVAFTTWYDATKAVSTAMRNDLKRLSGGLQKQSGRDSLALGRGP